MVVLKVNRLRRGDPAAERARAAGVLDLHGPVLASRGASLPLSADFNLHVLGSSCSRMRLCARLD